MIDATALEFGRTVFDLLFVSSLRAVALFLPIGLALLLIRSHRPALEHGVWTALLCGMLLLPALGSLSLLPMHTALSDAQVQFVVDAVKSVAQETAVVAEQPPQATLG